MKNKKITSAIVMIVIAVVLQSIAVSAEIISISAQGTDGVTNSIAENDFIQLIATVRLANDQEITTDQVLWGASNEFDSCEKSGDNFQCVVRVPETGTKRWYSAIPYTITLKNDAGATQDTKEDVVYVDNRPPIVEQVNIDQTRVSVGEITFNYKVTDKACYEAVCENTCSGIAKIELFEHTSDLIETIVVDSTDCTSTDFFDVSTLKFTEGEHTVFVKAYDLLNNPSLENSVTFILDKTAPVVDIGTFKVIDEIEEDILFYSNNKVNVQATVDIIDNNLETATVIADLSELGGGASEVAVCGTMTNGVTTCTWDLVLSINNPGTKTITIEAKDTTGNEGKTIISRDMKADTIGPEVTKIQSASQVNDVNYAKLTDNSFTASFKDAVGISPSQAILEASGTTHSADTCQKENTEWVCTWNNVDFNSAGEKEVKIGSRTTDRLGNKVQEGTAITVQVDTVAPIIKSITISGIGGSDDPLSNITKTGDNIYVEAVIEDTYIKEATADFSRFVSTETDVPGECSNTADNTFLCTFTSSGIDIPTYINDYVEITVTDIAGNTNQASEQLTVYGIDGTESVDFWRHEVHCSPQNLDRETFSLIEHRAYCQIFLSPNTVAGNVYKTIEPVSFSLDTCSGAIDNVNEIKLFNDGIGSVDPYARINFKKGNANINNITVTCPVSILTRKDNTIVVTPEIEHVTFQFGFFNSPLGEVSDSLQEKIDDAVESTNGMLSIVSSLKKIMFYAEKACNLILTGLQAWSGFQKITTMLSGAEKAASPIPGFGHGVYLQRVAYCNTAESFGETAKDKMRTLKKFCNFVNCQQDPGDWGKGKYLSWMGDWQKYGEQSIVGPIGGNVIKDWTGKDISSYMNAKDSIVLSFMTACVPGIIHNIDKYRQIQCLYADCLISAVGEQGLPIYVCEDQKAYSTCKYVVGEVFSVIPFTALFNHYAELIQDTLSNPFKILGATIAAGCQFSCKVPGGEAHFLCRNFRLVTMLTDMVGQVASIFSSSSGLFELPNDYCTELEEKLAEEEEEEEQNTR